MYTLIFQLVAAVWVQREIFQIHKKVEKIQPYYNNRGVQTETNTDKGLYFDSHLYFNRYYD